jgi:hypothetical protein
MKKKATITHSLTILLCSVILLVTSCNSSSSEATATDGPQIVARQLATVVPTITLGPTEARETQIAVLLIPTLAPPTEIPTATPYIGVFLGESEADVWDRSLNDYSQYFVLPTRDYSFDTSMICAYEVADVFGTLWTTDPDAERELRCPIQESYGFAGTVQIFEQGVMYFNTTTEEVWAVFPGTLQGNGEYWYVDRPPAISTEGLSAPEGLRVPRGAFGAAWANLPQIRLSLGYATTEEQPVSINIQRFDGGTMFLDVTVGHIFILLSDGEALGPY